MNTGELRLVHNSCHKLSDFDSSVKSRTTDKNWSMKWPEIVHTSAMLKDTFSCGPINMKFAPRDIC